MGQVKFLRGFAMYATLAGAAACIPQPPKTPRPAEPTIVEKPLASACSARSATAWFGGGANFTIEAMTDGPDCAQAVATLVIRNAKGESLWIDTFNTSQNMALAEAQTAVAMQTAVAAWIDQKDPQFKSTGNLPVWAPNQTQPALGEFPFYPEDAMTREDYNKLRTQKLPMFCYVQGIESEACLALHDGAFEKIGAQSFPG
jgi:hypothetical protein